MQPYIPLTRTLFVMNLLNVFYLIVEYISLGVGQVLQHILLQRVQFRFQFFLRVQQFQMHRIQFGILHFERVPQKLNEMFLFNLPRDNKLSDLRSQNVYLFGESNVIEGEIDYGE